MSGVNRGRWSRVGALLVQPLVLAIVVALREDSVRISIATSVLVALWVIAVGALAIRVIDAGRRNESKLVRFDALTSTGAATLLLADLALMLSGRAGWASLSVVGVLGIGVVFVAVLWLELVAGGDEPWRRAVIARSILPSHAVEGDPLREEVRLTDVKIPAGTRLFAQGRAAARLPITRYAVGHDGSGSDVVLGSELGPAIRGEHAVPPMALWIGDVLGLARSPVMYRGEAAFQVLPKLVAVDNADELLGRGGDDAMPTPTTILPTEGTFRMREYVPGDDTRRIHWVRSVNAGKLVVRLPDEVPNAEPTIRLILDTELAMEPVATNAPDEVLDGMVRTWLAIGKALVEAGHRVVLVTAAPKLVSKVYVPRSREPQKLGAKVAWQASVPLAQMLDPKTRQLVVSCRPRKLDDASVAWVVVPEGLWAQPGPSYPWPNPVLLAYPQGSPENRGSRRRRERKRIEAISRDREYFKHHVASPDWAVATGGLVARPRDGRIDLGVIK